MAGQRGGGIEDEVLVVAMGHSSGRTIPAETVRVARAANPRGTAAMWIRDRLDGLFVDEDFTDWYPADGRPELSPAQLALVSVLQFAENPTDRQAAQAVACRIDWKYCLGLELDAPGFDHSVLCEFRDRMAEGDRADPLLAVMVDRLVAAGLVKSRGRQRTDSTHVLAAVRTRLRLGRQVDVLRRVWVQQYWYDRAGQLRWRGPNRPGTATVGGARHADQPPRRRPMGVRIRLRPGCRGRGWRSCPRMILRRGQSQAGQGEMDRLQGPPDRDLR